MADAPEIKVKLTAEDTGVSAAIKELTSQLKNLKKQQDETAQSGLSLKKAFEGIAAAGALLKLTEFGKQAFDSAINIGKMALVTSRLGGMTAGFQKATAAQLIFSKGGAEFIPVANAIAGEGFDKI